MKASLRCPGLGRSPMSARQWRGRNTSAPKTHLISLPGKTKRSSRRRASRISEPRTAIEGGPDAITLRGSASEPLRPYRTILCSAHILVEPLDGARPCLLGRGFVVAFRRRVIEEAMNRIRIKVAFIPDVVFLQLRFLRRIGPRQILIEGAVVDEDGRLD